MVGWCTVCYGGALYARAVHCMIWRCNVCYGVYCMLGRCTVCYVGVC